MLFVATVIDKWIFIGHYSIECVHVIFHLFVVIKIISLGAQSQQVSYLSL